MTSMFSYTAGELLFAIKLYLPRSSGKDLSISELIQTWSRR
jgi:hypothetical protein